MANIADKNKFTFDKRTLAKNDDLTNIALRLTEMRSHTENIGDIIGSIDSPDFSPKVVEEFFEAVDMLEGSIKNIQHIVARLHNELLTQA